MKRSRMLRPTGESSARYARKRGGDRSREGERDRVAPMCLSNESENWEPQRLQGRAGSWRVSIQYVQVSPSGDSARVDPRALHELRCWEDQDL